MKRFIFILAMMLFGVCCFAQDEIREFSFKNTRFIEGASKEDLYSMAKKWGWDKDKRDGVHGSAGFYDSSNPIVEYYHIVKDCPNFGLSPLLGGLDHTRISFIINIICRAGSYTAEISHIDVYSNPDLGILYEENGRLSEIVYNRKQLKMGEKIVSYLFDYADEIFDEIYEYMSGK